MSETSPDGSSIYYDPNNVAHDFRDFENIPAELRALPQWVLWKLETVKGRLTKVPYTVEGEKADSTRPQTWGPFESCRNALRSNKFFGLGFVFAYGGEFTGIDFDKHRDAGTGELDTFAAGYVSRLNSYTELSQSGTGVHTIARATIPDGKGRRDTKSGVEMYSKARFFVMTGKHLAGTPRTVESRQQAVEGMFREIFPPKEKTGAKKTVTAGPRTLSDRDLIDKASQSKNGAKFSALWRGDFAATGYGSQSEADGGLLSMLYFWTRGDKARSFSLFSQSGLNRDKWQREDYRESTWRLVANGDIYWPTPQKIAASGSNRSDNIRGEIVRVLLDGKLTQTEQRTQIANAVVSALARRGRFFFHIERKNFDSAMYFDNGRKQLLRIRSDAFCAWLADWLAVNRADAVFKFVISAVETTALAGSLTTGILPESFWASRPGAIYLSNGDGQLAKITPGKVEVVDNGADDILFAAGNTLASWTLTEPKDPVETCSLFSSANCAASHGLNLFRLWLFSLPTNPASKPPVCFAGEIGSGKTRLAKGVAEFYGLPFVANKVEDFGEDSFWTSLDAGGLFTLDNCDTRNKWLPDAVASAATDGCSQRRKLYTDSERVTLRARAWLALTTANATFASDSGLADRLLVIRMNRRTDETSDAKLSVEIRNHRNAGLSYIAQTLAAALADTHDTSAGLNQRHPDFAKFAVRIGRAIGRESESIHALKAGEQDKSLFCLENDDVGAVLLAQLNHAKTFTGTAGELRQKLTETDPEFATEWSAKRLGKRLSTLWPHLETVLHAKQETGRGRVITYTLTAPQVVSVVSFKRDFD